MLVIIGKNDVPLYEVNLKIIKKDINITHHFALHSSLDSLDEIVHQNNNMFLKRIDQSGEFNIYGYVTATNIKFLLLIDDKKEDVI